MKIFSKLEPWFSLNTRSLALMRIGLGFLIFLDLIIRMLWADWHYSDQGLIPREIWSQEIAWPGHFSFFNLNGSAEFSLFLLIFHSLIALLLALGWKTFFVTILNALLLISLHNRNPFLQNGGDNILQVICLLAIFLPWGEQLSMDSKKKDFSPKNFTGPWVWCFYFTVFSIYFVSFIFKLKNPLWFPELSALQYAFLNEAFVNGLGQSIGDFPLLLKATAVLTLILESLGPLLLMTGFIFSQKSSSVLKRYLICSFILFHVLTSIFMIIGIFPYYCIFMWLAFWPMGDSSSEERTKDAKFILGLITLSILFLFNFSLLFQVPGQPLIRQVAQRVYLNQTWTMFSGTSKEKIGWKIFVVDKAGNKKIWTQHLQSKATHSDTHWRKYLGSMINDERLRIYYARAVCRMDSSLRSVEINEERSLLIPSKLDEKSLKTVLFHQCQTKI